MKDMERKQRAKAAAAAEKEAQAKAAQKVSRMAYKNNLGGRREAYAASFIAAPCLAVFGLWTWATWYEIEQRERRSGKPHKEGWFKLLGIATPPPPITYKDMSLNFTQITALLLQGHQQPHVLVTSAFSHFDAAHLGLNMLGLYLASINIPLPKSIGTGRFVGLFVLSGLAGNLVQIAANVYCYNKTNDAGFVLARSLGASGGISGLVATACLWKPRRTILMPGFMIDGIPTWTYLLLTIGYDVWGMETMLSQEGRGQGQQTAHGAHLGGAAIGVTAFFK